MNDLKSTCLFVIIALTLLIAILLIVKQRGFTRNILMVIILAIINVLILTISNVWIMLGYDVILLLIVTVAYGLGKFKEEFPLIYAILEIFFLILSLFQ